MDSAWFDSFLKYLRADPSSSDVSNVRRAPQSFDQIEKLLEKILLQSAQISQCDRAGIFLINPAKPELVATKIYYQGFVLDGEEKINMVSGSLLDHIYRRGDPFQKIGEGCYFFALSLNGRLFGALRIEKDDPFQFTPKRKHHIVRQMERMSYTLINQILMCEIQEQQRRLHILTRIHAAISQSIDIKSLLEGTVRIIQQVFCMDRVRIYTSDAEDRVLTGQVSCDFKGRVLPIHDEIALNNPPGPRSGPEYEKWFAHNPAGLAICAIPLMANNRRAGLLLVDNLLSQEPISETTLRLLEMVSAHIALAIKNAALFERVKQMSVTDSLTGLYLPRYFTQRAMEEISRAQRQRTESSLVILDLDSFKKINDTHGHLMGDHALKTVAAKISECIRKFDIAVRYGGDEFIVFMFGTGAKDAAKIIERLQEQLFNSPLTVGKDSSLRISLSAGVATFPLNGQTVEELMEKADQALYAAKRMGGNHVVVYSPAETPVKNLSESGT